MAYSAWLVGREGGITLYPAWQVGREGGREGGRAGGQAGRQAERKGGREGGVTLTLVFHQVSCLTSSGYSTTVAPTADNTVSAPTEGGGLCFIVCGLLETSESGESGSEERKTVFTAADGRWLHLTCTPHTQAVAEHIMMAGEG